MKKVRNTSSGKDFQIKTEQKAPRNEDSKALMANKVAEIKRKYVFKEKKNSDFTFF
jgi:hypothetical protein